MSFHISEELLSLYLDDRTRQRERKSVERHLSTCGKCRGIFLSIKASKDALKAVPEVTGSEGFDFEFNRRLKEELVKRDRLPVYQKRFQDMLEGLRPTILRPVPILVRAVAAVTTTAFLTIFVVWSQIGVIPAVAGIKGVVEIYDLKNDKWQAAKEGMRLKPGSIIRVAKGSEVNIESKRYEIMLKEKTEINTIDLERPFGKNNDIFYGLNRGKILVATKKGFNGSRLKIDSPLAEVEAKGTGFLVNVSPLEGNKTWVGVLDGTVEVRSKIKLAKVPSRVLVEAGKATEIQAYSPPTEPRYQFEREWKEVQEIYRIGEHPQVALLVSMTPGRVYELLRPAGLYITDKKTKAMPNALIEIAGRINEAIAKKDKKRHSEAVRDLKKLIKKYPDPKYNIQFLFFIAGYYYYLDKYKESILILERIIKEYGNSSLVSLALCAEGLIYEKKLNDHDDAVSAYEAVIARYPKSLEVKEARAGLNRLGAR